MTGGQDALGIHSYSLEGYYGFSSRRANFSFRYAYDGLFPTLSLAYSDSVRVLPRQRLLLAHPGVEAGFAVAAARPPALPAVRIRRPAPGAPQPSSMNQAAPAIPWSFNGFRLGLEFNSAREYYDSISPADGMRFTTAGLLSARRHGQRSGQPQRPGRPAALHPPVPARGAGLAPGRWPKSWDDPYGFTMGGLTGGAGSGLGNNHPFDLLRGFPTGLRSGQGRLSFQPGIPPAPVQDRKSARARLQHRPGLAERVFRHGPPFVTSITRSRSPTRSAPRPCCAWPSAVPSIPTWPWARPTASDRRNTCYLYLRTGRSF